MSIAAYKTGSKRGLPAAYRGGVAARQSSRMVEFLPPSRGLVTADNTGKPKPGTASLLNNFWPTERGAKVRRGSLQYAKINQDVPIKTIAEFRSGNIQKLFAFTDGGAFDVSSPANPATPIAPIAGFVRTEGFHSFAQLQTSGAYYLVVVNGQDIRAVYDGTSWTTTGPLQITGVDTVTLSHVWIYGGRLFYVEKNTFNAWYTGVDFIGGAAVKFPMQGVFSLGGSLLFGARLSADNGSGINDYCLFVSTEGEVAVYVGGDPSTAATWGLVGVYQIGKPMGSQAHIDVNGDLLIATQFGLISMRAAMSNSATGGALDLATLSRDVQPDWQNDVRLLAADPWTLHFYPFRQCVIVRMSTISSRIPAQWAYNVITKAWSRLSPWDAQSMLASSNRVVIGESNGTVTLVDITSSDKALTYTAEYISGFSDCGSVFADLTARIVSCQLFASQDYQPKISVLVNFDKAMPVAPQAAPNTNLLVQWDGGAQWDTDGVTWDAKLDARGFEYRSGASGIGRSLATCVQITIGGGYEPECELTMTAIQVERVENTA